MENSAKITKKGRPKSFGSEEDFFRKVKEYIKLCNEIKHEMPNLQGFCAYSDISRDTFYAQKNYYSDTYKKVLDIFEDAILNTRFASSRVVILYLKNRYSYENSRRIIWKNKDSGSLNYDLSKLSMDELKILGMIILKCSIKANQG